MNKIEKSPILSPFKRFCVTIGNLPSSYVDSMSYYECIMWLCKYLKDTVIPAVNENAEAVNELINWFNNLDVTEEVNNKLDTMVEDGSLQRMIGQYINPYLTEFNVRLDNQDTRIDEQDQQINIQDGNINNQNIRLNQMDSRINSLASGSPLVASSTAGMSDTSKIYVNTTDGNWYYYDGDSWEIGGVYQAAENSTKVNNIEKFTTKMVKHLANNTITISIDSTSTVIQTKNSNNVFLISGNEYKSVASSVFNKTFLISDYNINSGRWILVLQNNVLNLVSIVNTPSLSYNDMILAIITPQEIITFIQDKFIINNNNYHLNYRNTVFPTIKDSYNDLFIIDDTVNKTLTIKTGASYFIGITDIGYMTYYNTSGETVSYNVSDSGNTSNLMGVVYNIFDTTHFRIIQLPTSDLVEAGVRFYPHYNKKYGDVLVCGYNKASHKLFPFNVKQLYFNGELISSDKLDSRVTNLENQISDMELTKYDFISCFHKFTGIGDSLMGGYTSVDDHTIDTATALTAKNNWFDYLMNRINREGSNLAVGSSTAHNWRYNDQAGGDSDISRANIDTDCYFVGIGVNDIRNSGTVGSSSDIDDSNPSDNADSFYGNYDYIVRKLKSYKPYAKIFVFTVPNSESGATNYNTAIKYIANLYDNVYCIDLDELYDFSDGFIADNLSNGHYNPITYNYISVLIEKACNDYIFENYTEFQLIPYLY